MACVEKYGRECTFIEDFGSGNPEPGTHWLKGILMETAILIVLYRIVFFMGVKPALEYMYKSNKKTWDYMLTFKGMFHPNVQIEVVYLSILSVHHIIGGAMMVYGVVYERPDIWIQGAIFDLVDAVHDTFLMILPAWPFSDRNPQLLMLLIPHHAFSFVITVPAIVSGLGHDTDAQTIGACLLAAGGISAGALCFTRTCDRRDPAQAWQEAICWICNTIFYDYCRFYVFPIAVYNIISTKWSTYGVPMQAALVLVVLFMTFFNVMIGLDVHLTTLNRLKTALAGGEKPKDK